MIHDSGKLAVNKFLYNEGKKKSRWLWFGADKMEQIFGKRKAQGYKLSLILEVWNLKIFFIFIEGRGRTNSQGAHGATRQAKGKKEKLTNTRNVSFSVREVLFFFFLILCTFLLDLLVNGSIRCSKHGRFWH